MKKQWVILVSDLSTGLPKDDFVGWVLQIPEDESPATTRIASFAASMISTPRSAAVSCR